MTEELSPIVQRWWNQNEYKLGHNPVHKLIPFRTPFKMEFRKTQKGGGKHIYGTINSHVINIYEDNEDENTLMFVGGPKSYPSCFRLSLNLSNKEASLDDLYVPHRSDSESLSYSCFEDGTNESRLVVKVAIALARKKGAKTLVWTDNSTKHCLSNWFRLSDYYHLLTGETWYESILREVDSHVRIELLMPKHASEIYKTDQKKAAKISWKEMRGTISNPSFSSVLTEIDETEPGTARRVLQELRKLRTDEICEYVGEHLHKFLANSGISSLHGTWWKATFSHLSTRKTRKKKKTLMNIN